MIKIRFGILIESPSPSINGIFLRARKAEENSFDSLWIAAETLKLVREDLKDIKEDLKNLGKA